jgi:hypothetical protein
MKDSSKSDDGAYQKVISAIGGNMAIINSQDESKTSSLMPLTVSVNIGSRMILSAEAAYILVTGGAVAGGSIPFVGDGIQTAAIILSPMLNKILSTMINVGDVLTFVNPMLPYMIGFLCRRILHINIRSISWFYTTCWLCYYRIRMVLLVSKGKDICLR